MTWFDKIHLLVLSASLYAELRGRPEAERVSALVHHGLCPNCRARLTLGTKGILIDGPRGGLAQNRYCPDCQHGWNYTPGVPEMPVQALGLIDPQVLALYQSRMVWHDKPPLD